MEVDTHDDGFQFLAQLKDDLDAHMVEDEIGKVV